MNVVLTGLPQSGKSTMLTALAGKQLFESGVSSSNQNLMIGEVNVFNIPKFYKTALYSTDGVKMNILSVRHTFPFASIIANVDTILWATSIEDSFSTKQESRAFDKVCELIAKEAENGHLIKLSIIVTKSSVASNFVSQHAQQTSFSTGAVSFMLNTAQFNTNTINAAVARVSSKRVRYACYNSFAVIYGITDNTPIENTAFNMNWAVHTQDDYTRLLTEQFTSYVSKLTACSETMVKFTLYDEMIEKMSHDTIINILTKLTTIKNDKVKLHLVDCLASMVTYDDLLSLFSTETLVVAMYIIGQTTPSWKRQYLDDVYTLSHRKSITWISKNYKKTIFAFDTAKNLLNALPLAGRINIPTYTLDNRLCIQPTLKYSLDFANEIYNERKSIYGEESNASSIISDVASGVLDSLLQPLNI